MPDCECLSACPFFNDKMAGMPAIAGIYKRNYCKTDNSECARYLIFKALGRMKVPVDLFPNQKERAEKILHNQ